MYSFLLPGWLPAASRMLQLPPGAEYFISNNKIEILTSENLYFDLNHDFLGWCTPTCSQVGFQQPPGFSSYFQGLNILILITKFKSLPIKTYILTYIMTFWVGVPLPAPRLASSSLQDAPATSRG